MEKEYLLTFELSKDKNELEVYTDLNGLRFLIEELNKLLKSTEKDGSDHTHFMTEEWAGNELTSVAQSGEILNHIKVYCIKAG